MGVVPELVAPAGTWPSLTAALDSGADAVYFGAKSLSMRAFAGNFEVNEIKKVVDLVKKHGKKAYLALNTIVMQHQLKTMKRIVDEAVCSGVDALIAADMSVINYAVSKGLAVHGSTQLSISNAEAVAGFAKIGIKRAVLARECSLKDISEIYNDISSKDLDFEIEAFVHGAMCLSISGRCFMSLYSDGRSANQGACAQPCRREYKITAIDNSAEFIVGQDYILSPKDLCSIEFLDLLMDAGARAFKIEGRMRPPEYVKEVVSAYREAIDLILEDRYSDKDKQRLKQRVSNAYNRGLSSGFYFHRPDKEIGRWWHSFYEKRFLGQVRRFYPKIGVAEIELLASDLILGDRLLFIGKRTGAKESVAESIHIDGNSVEKALKRERIGVKLPFKVYPGDKVFLLVKRGVSGK